MVHVEITDKELWFYSFLTGMMSIFFERDETTRSELMFTYFIKLLDEKSEELNRHFKKSYPGRYSDSPEGLELRKGIEKRHDEALSMAIQKFPEEYWTTIIADMVMWSFHEKTTDEVKKIIHEIIIPMYSGKKDLEKFQSKIVGCLDTRLYIFSENEKENLISEAGF